MRRNQNQGSKQTHPGPGLFMRALWVWFTHGWLTAAWQHDEWPTPQLYTLLFKRCSVPIGAQRHMTSPFPNQVLTCIE